MSFEVATAIKFLPASDLEALAALLGISPPSAPELERRCASCPKTADAVRRYLFRDSRSRTPPRRAMKLETPPPVVRPSRRQPQHTPPRRLCFE